MAGKTKPTSSQLTSDNVCFDVTSGIASDSPDSLPMVFSTGYIVTYKAGANASPASGAESPSLGFDMGTKGMQVSFLKANSDGTVSGFVPADFDPGTKTYRQLRP